MSMSPAMSPLTDSEPRRELGTAFGAPSSPADELGLDDAGLIQAYLGGNPAAYGELVRRHQIGIFRLMLGLLADEDRAELACEQVFLLAERRLAGLAEGNQYYQWLLGLAREVSRAFTGEAGREDTGAPEPLDPRERLRREIHAVLQQLAPDQRLVLVLVELRGAPDDDVAAALGCARAEVPQLVSSARAEFTRILATRASTAPQVRADAGPLPRLRKGDIVAGRYKILREIAEGGMGAVYVAERLSDGTEVAVKTVLPGLVRDATSLRRFEREVEAIRRIDHEGFVRILDHGTAGEQPFFVMELLRGVSLGALVRGGATVESTRALSLVSQVLRGLAHAHAVGVIHRDLKPDNVFVVEAGEGERVKILDLGLAKLMSDDEGRAHTALTERGMVFGTPAYMSPEQALGEEVDARTDLYAAGVILFQLLTGRLPFESGSPAAILVMHVSSPPPRLVECAPHLDDPSLQALLDRALAKPREDRYADADALRAAIERVLAGRGGALGPTTMHPVAVSSPEPASPAATPAQGPARGRWALAALALVVAAWLAALAWLR